MTAYIVRRILLMIPTLLGMTLVVFFIMAAAPGDVAEMLISAEGQMRAGDRQARIEYVRKRYGLDQPAVVQYGRWLNQVSPVGFVTSSQVTFEEDELNAAAQELIESDAAFEKVGLENTRRMLAALAPYEGMTLDEEVAHLKRVTSDLDSTLHYLVATDYLEPQDLAIKADAELAEDAGGVGLEDRRRRARQFVAAVRTQAKEDPQAARIAAVEKLATESRGLDRVLFTRPTLKAPDFGRSFINNRPVVDLLGESLPITVLLNVLSLPLVYVFALISGVYAARHRGGLFDVSSSVVMLALWSIPTIWAGIMLQGFLAREKYLDWFPTTGLHSLRSDAMPFLPVEGGLWQTLGFAVHVLLWVLVVACACVMVFAMLRLLYTAATERPAFSAVKVGAIAAGVGAVAFAISWSGLLPGKMTEFNHGWLLDALWHLVLPVVCLGYSAFAFMSKLSRGAVLENIMADYVRTARAKGLRDKDVLWRHAFRNSLLPLITVAAFIIPGLLGGSIIVEYIFGINGMGKLTITAIEFKDREVVMAVTLMSGVLTLGAYLIADLLYAVADPRVTYE